MGGRRTIAGLEGRWQRLHPLSPLVRAGRGLVPLILILLIPAYHRGSGGEFEHGAIIVAVFVLALISWLVTRWRVEAGVLRVDSGLIRRTSERFPLSQIQAIDVVRPGLARVFGLAELRIRLAGGGRTAGRLAYLNSHEADLLRSRLLALSHGVHEETLAAPERPLLTVPPTRLLVSLTLSGTGLVLELVAVGLLVLAALRPSLAATAVSTGTVWLVGLALAIFRQFNRGYRFTVADARDGLRLRSGLVETTAETIPRGRIQAVRMIEPLLWQLFGWCRLEVDVAGQKPRGGQDRAATKAVRALLPVGTREEASLLLASVFGELPTKRLAPPRRALLKNPLRFRRLSWAANERYAVTTSGRLWRTSDWVPLSKVQSFRLVEGPVQRALKLASVHLDTAGRNVHAIMRDRDRAEAEELMRVLPERCRRARLEDDRPRRGSAIPVQGSL
jgi:putative membrane protein